MSTGGFDEPDGSPCTSMKLFQIMLPQLISIKEIWLQGRCDKGRRHNHGPEGQAEDDYPTGRPPGALQRENQEERRDEITKITYKCPLK